MSIIEIASLLLLCIFGIAYFSKLIVLSKSNHINANVFGKGNKPKKTLIIEKILKTITFAGVAIWIVNIFLSKATEKYFIKIFENYFVSWLGLVATFIGVLFFISAMVFMKTSWRAGIDKSTKTSLVTSGLYKFSRNPAFVGMDLMFIGVAITYTNLVTLLSALLVIVGLHLQILQEEKHMEEMFEKEYNEYAIRTARYLWF